MSSNKGKTEKPVEMAAFAEHDRIDRKMLVWANTFPEIPVEFRTAIEASAPAASLRAVQNTRVTKRYIMGGYEGEYAFAVTYRIKPGDSENNRLKALETLNNFADWARTQRPDIGEGLRVCRIEAQSRATLLQAYTDGDEDYQILMKMTYERI